jgi:hypothetical protein
MIAIHFPLWENLLGISQYFFVFPLARERIFVYNIFRETIKSGKLPLSVARLQQLSYIRTMQNGDADFA